MAVRIITDSAADFDLTEAERLRVGVVPMSVQFGAETFVTGETITNDAFYRMLRERDESPSTSQPTPAAFLNLFEEAKAAGDEAVVILISGELSGTIQSAAIAKEMCGYDPIFIVDSRSATAGMQLLVNYACTLRDGGLSAAVIAGQVELLRNKIRIFAVIDTLEYLRRGGRLSGFQAGLGTLTRLKPTITVRDGLVVIAGKSFGMTAAVRQMQKFLEEHPIDGDFPAFFLYSDSRDVEDLLFPRLEEQGMLPRQLRYCQVGPAIGTHVGPGALGMAYIEQP